MKVNIRRAMFMRMKIFIRLGLKPCEAALTAEKILLSIMLAGILGAGGLHFHAADRVYYCLSSFSGVKLSLTDSMIVRMFLIVSHGIALLYRRSRNNASAYGFSLLPYVNNCSFLGVEALLVIGV